MQYGNFSGRKAMLFHISIFIASLRISLLNLDQLPLEEYQNQQIEVRGYVKQSQSGDWFLSSESNLPICCVGIVQRLKNQIALNPFPGVETLEGRLSTLQGTFHIEEKEQENGTRVRYYSLKHE